MGAASRSPTNNHYHDDAPDHDDYDHTPNNYDYDHTADDHYDHAPKNYDYTTDYDDGATALVSAVPPCPCSPHAKDRNTPREAELRA